MTIAAWWRVESYIISTDKKTYMSGVIRLINTLIASRRYRVATGVLFLIVIIIIFRHYSSSPGWLAGSFMLTKTSPGALLMFRYYTRYTESYRLATRWRLSFKKMIPMLYRSGKNLTWDDSVVDTLVVLFYPDRHIIHPGYAVLTVELNKFRTPPILDIEVRTFCKTALPNACKRGYKINHTHHHGDVKVNAMRSTTVTMTQDIIDLQEASLNIKWPSIPRRSFWKTWLGKSVDGSVFFLSGPRAARKMQTDRNYG